jgi:hypothetical protein
MGYAYKTKAHLKVFSYESTIANAKALLKKIQKQREKPRAFASRSFLQGMQSTK